MSEVSLIRTAGDRLPESDPGDLARGHQLAFRVTLSVLAWLRPIATAAARVYRRAGQERSKISDRSSQLDINAGTARPLLKVRGWLARLALSMRPRASTIESGRFVLRCSAAASLAYGLATLVGFQHPFWAPIEALVVSQEGIGDTLDSIYGRLVGTLIGVMVALLAGIFGRMSGLPLMLQIALSVTVCALATFGRPTIRVCLWTCPLILVTAPSPGTTELAGLIRVSQVLLGAMVGGIAHVLDQRAWNGWNSLSPVQPSCHPADKARVKLGFTPQEPARMNNISCRQTRAQLDAEMPLRRYFLFVGGALLALLFVASWLVPATNARTGSAVNFPPIRIHSDRKGPEAVVIDTSKSIHRPSTLGLACLYSARIRLRLNADQPRAYRAIRGVNRSCGSFHEDASRSGCAARRFSSGSSAA
jgi:Fusaric acid resistance protein-like